MCIRDRSACLAESEPRFTESMITLVISLPVILKANRISILTSHASKLLIDTEISANENDKKTAVASNLF